MVCSSKDLRWSRFLVGNGETGWSFPDFFDPSFPAEQLLASS